MAPTTTTCATLQNCQEQLAGAQQSRRLLTVAVALAGAVLGLQTLLFCGHRLWRAYALRKSPARGSELDVEMTAVNGPVPTPLPSDADGLRMNGPESRGDDDARRTPGLSDRPRAPTPNAARSPERLSRRSYSDAGIVHLRDSQVSIPLPEVLADLGDRRWRQSDDSSYRVSGVEFEPVNFGGVEGFVHDDEHATASSSSPSLSPRALSPRDYDDSILESVPSLFERDQGDGYDAGTEESASVLESAPGLSRGCSGGPCADSDRGSVPSKRDELLARLGRGYVYSR